jgi:hypothetical protein
MEVAKSDEFSRERDLGSEHMFDFCDAIKDPHICHRCGVFGLNEDSEARPLVGTSMMDFVRSENETHEIPKP